LSFEIGQWYLVCGCMTIRWCVAYRNDLRGTLIFDRYLKLMSPLNAALYNNKLHIMSWMILFKKQLFDLEVKDQGPTKVITVRDTPPHGHAPTYQISLYKIVIYIFYVFLCNYFFKVSILAHKFWDFIMSPLRTCIAMFRWSINSNIIF
jgi:hypothetical protein